MYVYVDQEGGHCPDGFLGQVLLGVVEPPRGVEWEFTGGNWGLYDKSQEVRFVVNWPDDGVVRPLCDDPGDLYKEVMLVRASVLDESSPTFFVNSMQSQGELIDEVS
jgi:hypothetical protein